MTSFHFEGDVDLEPDDELLIGDGIRCGSIVYFARVGGHKVVVRTLADADPASFRDRAYRTERGDPAYAPRFTRSK